MEIWNVILTSAVTTAVLPFVGKRFIDNYFKNRLEDHKHDLSLLSKGVDFDYQRQIHDFNLFSSKKHEVYAELYSQLVNAKNEMEIVTSNYRQYPKFKDYTVENVSEFLTGLAISQEEIDRLTGRFDLDKTNTINELTAKVDYNLLSEANITRVKTTEYLLKSEIYLSEKVSELTHDITDNFNKLTKNENMLIEIRSAGKINPEISSKQKKLNEQLVIQLKELREKMQEEISVGYYNKDNTDQTREN